MQYFPRGKAVPVLIGLGLILVVFMLLGTMKTVTHVSAVETVGVGVYWNSNCTDRILSIYWGTLTPGSVKNTVVYIRNEAEEPMFFIMKTRNWNPLEASDHISLKWNYNGQRTNPSEILQIILTLSASRHIEGISDFSFDILITGSDRLPGDVDGDGDVDGGDLRKIQLALFSVPGDPRWNPNADVDEDGDVDSGDQKIWGLHFFEGYR